jgi:hypothetical protein
MMLLTGCLAVLTLAALLLGRLPALIRLGTQASAKLERSRLFPALWGLAASLLLFLLAAVLFHGKTFALLGLLVLMAGLVLAGLGSAVAALSVGTRLTDALGLLETGHFDALRLGFWVFGFASAVPFAGWLLVLSLLASGVGAVLETLVTRKT